MHRTDLLCFGVDGAQSAVVQFVVLNTPSDVLLRTTVDVSNNYDLYLVESHGHEKKIHGCDSVCVNCICYVNLT